MFDPSPPPPKRPRLSLPTDGAEPMRVYPVEPVAPVAPEAVVAPVAPPVGKPEDKRRVGRPQLLPERRRSQRVEFALRPAEVARLQRLARAAGASVSAYVAELVARADG